MKSKLPLPGEVWAVKINPSYDSFRVLNIKKLSDKIMLRYIFRGVVYEEYTAMLCIAWGYGYEN